MNIRRSTLLGTAIAFALYHQSASAQTAATASDDGEDVGEIIVTGIRASLEQSLEGERGAGARLEVVTGEDNLPRIIATHLWRANGLGRAA